MFSTENYNIRPTRYWKNKFSQIYSLQGGRGCQLPDVLFCISEVDIDYVVEKGKDEEWSQGSHGHPGPGCVPDDVVLTQPQLCWLHIFYLNHEVS